nr:MULTISPECIES: AMP-binding protein [Streptomyces]
MPATYHRLVGSAGAAPRALRMCLVAGAPSGPALRAAVEEDLGAPLFDAYGSTETCGMIAADRPGGPGSTAPAGRPCRAWRCVSSIRAAARTSGTVPRASSGCGRRA